MKIIIAILLLSSLLGCGGSSSDSKETTPPPQNSAPVANAGVDQNLSAGNLVELDGSASIDADGDTLTYLWTLTTPDESLATLSNTTSSKPTFIADLSGSYVASLVVSDGTDTSTTASITIAARGVHITSSSAVEVTENIIPRLDVILNKSVNIEDIRNCLQLTEFNATGDNPLIELVISSDYDWDTEGAEWYVRPASPLNIKSNYSLSFNPNCSDYDQQQLIEFVTKEDYPETLIASSLNESTGYSTQEIFYQYHLGVENRIAIYRGTSSAKDKAVLLSPDHSTLVEANGHQGTGGFWLRATRPIEELNFTPSLMPCDKALSYFSKNKISFDSNNNLYYAESCGPKTSIVKLDPLNNYWTKLFEFEEPVSALKASFLEQDKFYVITDSQQFGVVTQVGGIFELSTENVSQHVESYADYRNIIIVGQNKERVIIDSDNFYYSGTTYAQYTDDNGLNWTSIESSVYDKWRIRESDGIVFSFDTTLDGYLYVSRSNDGGDNFTQDIVINCNECKDITPRTMKVHDRHITFDAYDPIYGGTSMYEVLLPEELWSTHL